MLVELDGDSLHVYGEALDALDRSWPAPVTAICFHYVPFDLIIPHLVRLRGRFLSVHTLVFADTHLHSLPQLAQLSSLRRLEVSARVLCFRV